MIRSFIQKVILFDDKIEIYYNFTNNYPTALLTSAVG